VAEIAYEQYGRAFRATKSGRPATAVKEIIVGVGATIIAFACIPLFPLLMFKPRRKSSSGKNVKDF